MRCPFPVGETSIRQKTLACTPNAGSTWTEPQSSFKGHTKIIPQMNRSLRLDGQEHLSCERFFK